MQSICAVCSRKQINNEPHHLVTGSEEWNKINVNSLVY